MILLKYILLNFFLYWITFPKFLEFYKQYAIYDYTFITYLKLFTALQFVIFC